MRQRAYFYGQEKVHERVEIYEAILQVANHIYSDEENEDRSFKIRNLSIAYKHFRPLSEYAKKRREYIKSKRNKS